jgi:hypothetical protein
MTLFQKVLLRFLEKNYDGLSMFIESKSKGRKTQFGGHRVQTLDSQAKKSKRF